MSISAYNASLAIPPYPGPIRSPEAKPSTRDINRNQPQPQQPVARSETALPSTGLLNTVV